MHLESTAVMQHISFQKTAIVHSHHLVQLLTNCRARTFPDQIKMWASRNTDWRGHRWYLPCCVRTCTAESTRGSPEEQLSRTQELGYLLGGGKYRRDNESRLGKRRKRSSKYLRTYPRSRSARQSPRSPEHPRLSNVFATSIALFLGSSISIARARFRCHLRNAYRHHSSPLASLPSMVQTVVSPHEQRTDNQRQADAANQRAPMVSVPRRRPCSDDLDSPAFLRLERICVAARTFQWRSLSCHIRLPRDSETNPHGWARECILSSIIPSSLPPLAQHRVARQLTPASH